MAGSVDREGNLSLRAAEAAFDALDRMASSVDREGNLSDRAFSEADVARVVYDALGLGDPTAFLGEFIPDYAITVDGQFDFKVIARAVAKALR